MWAMVNCTLGIICSTVVVGPPPGGKVVLLEDLEASQLSPPSKLPFVPSGSSTPADSAVSSSNMVTVSRAAGSKPADARWCSSAPGTGPVHGHVPPGPAPALPAGAQVQTLEEIEAGLRDMNLPSSSPLLNNGSGGGGAGGGDLSAFNKLLHLVNKPQPAADQACSVSVASYCFLSPPVHLTGCPLVMVWLGGRVVRTMDVRSMGREFESWSPRYRVQP